LSDHTPSPLTEIITIDDGRMKHHLHLLELRLCNATSAPRQFSTNFPTGAALTPEHVRFCTIS
jgi:hypothetical protein